MIQPSINPEDFGFDLPAELIAQSPLLDRSSSRLLEVDASGRPQDLSFTDLPGILQAGDLLILNDTRVIPARLFGRKSTGGRVEMLLERQLETDLALVQLKSSRSPGVGVRLDFEGEYSAVVEGRRGEFFVLRFSSAVDEILETQGHMPLPPYIKRADQSKDRDRYQTVFARRPGAVAAPTAGLHFDQAMIQRIRSRDVDIGFLTLHVGAGTFQPLRPEQLDSGRLHAEYLEVSEPLCAAVNATRARGGRVVAVGTTSVRGLEAAALAGGESDNLVPFTGDTDLFIVPGFEFKVVDAMVTNFHLPNSSLLMLVCAFTGTEAVLGAYAHAVEQGYRFFSYGDAMFCRRRRQGDGRRDK
jgi:S-adenosylmethionine:tRNA ribosyltransferase-isomerase